ncbi:MAG: hypothetical protein R3F39_02330 [Myxococcota bacterium]
MTEIICISCWSSFEIDPRTAASAQVTCPLCGFVQAGPAPKPTTVPPRSPDTLADGPGAGGQRAAQRATTIPPDPGPVAGRGAAPPPLPPPVPGAAMKPAIDRSADPFSAIEAELGDLGFEGVLDASPSHEGSEVSAVSAILADIAGGGEGAPEGGADRGASAPTRWKLRTGSGLLLHFPTYETAIIWAAGHDGPLGITCGDLDFRRYKAFHHATKSIGDPLEALQATPSFEERPDLGAALPPEPLEPAHLTARAQESAPLDLGASAPARSAPPQRAPEPAPSMESPPSRPSRSRVQDFSFRTGHSVSIWPSRLIFLTLGIILGASAVYYLAWLGIMPGVQY